MRLSAKGAPRARLKTWGYAAACAVALAATVQTASAAPPPFAYGGLNWTVDRYNADAYTFPV